MTGCGGRRLGRGGEGGAREGVGHVTDVGGAMVSVSHARRQRANCGGGGGGGVLVSLLVGPGLGVSHYKLAPPRSYPYHHATSTRTFVAAAYADMLGRSPRRWR